MKRISGFTPFLQARPPSLAAGAEAAGARSRVSDRLRPERLAAPAVTYSRGRLTVSRLPKKAGVAELTIYRETKLDQATTPGR